MPSSKTSIQPNSQLQKAKLVPIPSGLGTPIHFMFNPTELKFDGAVETVESKGAKNKETGKNKVSFSNIKAYSVTIEKILFDTYEEGEDVIKKYIDPFRKAFEFAGGDRECPPLFRFIWGERQYLRACFLEKLNYRLTMFLPDGTPVRATIDSLVLKEVDESLVKELIKPFLPKNIKQRQQQRKKDSIENKLKNII